MKQEVTHKEVIQGLYDSASGTRGRQGSQKSLSRIRATKPSFLSSLYSYTILTACLLLYLAIPQCFINAGWDEVEPRSLPLPQLQPRTGYGSSGLANRSQGPRGPCSLRIYRTPCHIQGSKPIVIRHFCFVPVDKWFPSQFYTWGHSGPEWKSSRPMAIGRLSQRLKTHIWDYWGSVDGDKHHTFLMVSLSFFFEGVVS